MVEGKTVRPPSFSSSAAIVLDHPAAVPAAAQEWADRYESSRARATAEMLTLLVRAAGAPDDGVTPGEVEDGDVDALVARLVTAVTTDGVADPFKRRGGKAAKGAYGALWRAAVTALAGRALLGDSYFVDKATAVLLGLSW